MQFLDPPKCALCREPGRSFEYMTTDWHNRWVHTNCVVNRKCSNCRAIHTPRHIVCDKCKYVLCFECFHFSTGRECTLGNDCVAVCEKCDVSKRRVRIVVEYEVADVETTEKADAMKMSEEVGEYVSKSLASKFENAALLDCYVDNIS